MEQIEQWLVTINDVVWGWPLIILLFGTHIYLTIRLGFIQRFMGRAIKLSFTKDSGDPGDVSHFGALTTALAATVGTGNIFGVAGAVAIGGPGAVLWMWLTGVFGIATKYGEALLSVKYRVTMPDGRMAGGPMYVLERGLNAKWLGMLFALFTALAAFGIGNMVQSNTLTQMIDRITLGSAVMPHISSTVTGLILAIATAAVILGGIRSIANVCSFLVPIMAIIYIVGCIWLLILRAPLLGDTVMLIFRDAFTGTAATGGFVGAGIAQVVRMGIARGLFSNESGLGSAAIVAAAARTKNPVRQALVASTGTFWDTVVICALTGLVIVSSGAWQGGGDKQAVADAAFSDLPFGWFILTVGLLTFVFSTILGWSYYGEKAAEYLLGTKVIVPYRWAWVVAVFVGSQWKVGAVWDLADILNGLMAVPNLIALLLLSGVIVAETKAHRSEFTGKD